ncbi:MAG: hypothetical protein ACOVNU_05785 [Candidatus Kapaibacteriota bacterium]|jgi:hypothetical protein
MYLNFKSKLKKLLLLSFFILGFLITNLTLVYSEIIDKDNIKYDKEYIIRLKNGDIFSGFIVELVTNEDEGDGIKFKTSLGKTNIYFFQIAEINLKEEYYRHNHRVFLLPTAEPISNNHFIGNFELLLFYGGFGIGDIVSVTAGTSVVPTLNRDEQFSTLNLKFTVYNERFEDMDSKAAIALGGNLAFINHNNNFQHLYAVASFTGPKSVLTGGFFYKLGTQNNYELKFGREFLNANYFNGSFGVGLGLDTKFASSNDLHFIGELWNSDIASPTNTAVLLGLRLNNTRFSADFGLAFFTQPFAVPVFSFVWTPF